MMDWKVISVGSSSSEDTHHGASSSESSSLERMRVSRLTGGGTSRSRGRAWPSVASGELISITMILPLMLLGCEERSGGGDARASPRVRRSHSTGLPSSTPAVASYERVRDDVLKYKSSLTSAASVVALQCQVMLASPEDSCKIVI